MKTRCTQDPERLYQALQESIKAANNPPPSKCCSDCVSYLRVSPGLGNCALNGVMVRGRTERPCFRGRKI